MGIKENLKNILSDIPSNVQLVAVSKTKPNNFIQEAYDVGQRVFGENKVQELVKKHEDLPKDIQWHFIGHLQSNKVKYIAPFISLIHGVDSLKLLKTINKEAKKNNRVISCLLQVHIAQEQTKFGFDSNDVEKIVQEILSSDLSNINICGLMGMASYVNDEEKIKSEFNVLKELFNHLKNDYFSDKSYFKEISMGMSGDYKLAIDSGSTMVRIGSTIFGQRTYL